MDNLTDTIKTSLATNAGNIVGNLLLEISTLQAKNGYLANENSELKMQLKTLQNNQKVGDSDVTTKSRTSNK
ncbi:hypothetical protein FP435_04485 [Lactobacillus sp. PV037]|uniref:hypothetical protein n=1 Tax=Lactobacillus sp. PV037 TaxID=2594496 RepID=UPI0022405118|nr:hypothetical protein [Lactobacillus sp. PV037]QNQ83751.1 hypothetical protein FP435_04485 [Lactobacillus sp. PV037]